MPDTEGSTAEREARIFAIVDVVTMAAITILGAVVVAESTRLGIRNALGVGPGMFPLISGSVLLVLGAIGAVTSAVHLRRELAPDAVGANISSGISAPTAAGAASAQGDGVDLLHIDDEDIPAVEQETFTSVLWPRLAAAAALIFAFVLVVNSLGFIVSLTLFMFAMMKLVARRGWVLSVVLTLATSMVVYFGFGIFLGVALPGPSLPFLSWMN
jgi:putative tricarboxylic transport membrane protein